MRTCDTCNVEKPDPSFRLFGRGRKKTCLECEGGGSVKTAKTPAAEQKECAPRPIKLDGLHLEIARGFGFRASAEDGQLVIEQDAEDGTASVVLSRTEARVLFAQFAEWSAS